MSAADDHTIRALVIRPDRTVTAGSITAGLDGIKGAIDGGYLEMIGPTRQVSVPDLATWHAYLDEGGKAKGLPPNWLATAVAGVVGWVGGGDVLCGPVVFLGDDPDDPSGEGDVSETLVDLAVATARVGTPVTIVNPDAERQGTAVIACLQLMALPGHPDLLIVPRYGLGWPDRMVTWHRLHEFTDATATEAGS